MFVSTLNVWTDSQYISSENLFSDISTVSTGLIGCWEFPAINLLKRILNSIFALLIGATNVTPLCGPLGHLHHQIVTSREASISNISLCNQVLFWINLFSVSTAKCIAVKRSILWKQPFLASQQFRDKGICGLCRSDGFHFRSIVLNNSILVCSHAFSQFEPHGSKASDFLSLLCGSETTLGTIKKTGGWTCVCAGS